MIERVNCIYCANQSGDLKRFRARVSPFIENYALEAAAPPVSIAYCPRCQGGFIDHAYDDKEMYNLYHEYRGENYKAVREKYEKGYSELNGLLGNDSGEVLPRKKNLQRVLRRAMDGHNIRISSVLDWGGDVGQFIPDFPGVKKFLYDVSGKEPCSPDITALKSLSEGMRFDLILSCHVFEHVASPLASLLELKKYLSDGGMVYLELPYEFPKFNRRLSSILGRNVTVVMHEHINQFSVRSLVFLAKQAGLEVIHISLQKTNVWSLSVVCRKTGAAPSELSGLRGLELKEDLLSFLRFFTVVKMNLFRANAYKAVFSRL